jgi:hypothetical protein
MPRATPVRSRKQDPLRDSVRSPMTPEHRAWLTLWKEGAVEALPAMAPVDVKIEVRRAVETALAALGPEDHLDEIRDLVGAVVREFTDQLAEETRTQERETRKQRLLQSIEIWIDDTTLKPFPPEIVGAPRSPQRRHVLATLRQKIHETLADELTGDEPIDAVVSLMEDELAAWAVEQNPQVDRRTLLRRLAPWVVATVAGGVAVASWSPELKTAVRKGAQVLKTRLSPYKPIATGLWNYGLKQVDEWAQAHAKKEPPDEPAEK